MAPDDPTSGTTGGKDTTTSVTKTPDDENIYWKEAQGIEDDLREFEEEMAKPENKRLRYPDFAKSKENANIGVSEYEKKKWNDAFLE